MMRHIRNFMHMNSIFRGLGVDARTEPHAPRVHVGTASALKWRSMCNTWGIEIDVG